ncbi:hypothetical protein SOV_47990 [Sporomusa ovata DSM 2662]|uniref:Uncharacterized protein n=1 Tax=Sporomusa ovata TaxID=2378 RepID=A0A0U1L1H4_9FIRM|nr:hypothetical protein [Sporomusa ovata]EQB27176.1 hypothetical protein SOV_2c00680 [Sporomusa ovata DSM 2662]CQR73013.1 hypothetical protein SpAn4DRAFT_2245 [Sporomusa ovata]
MHEIIDAISEGVYTTDKDGTIESAMRIVENTASELMVEDLFSFLLKQMFGDFASNINNPTEVERTAAIQLTE